MEISFFEHKFKLAKVLSLGGYFFIPWGLPETLSSEALGDGQTVKTSVSIIIIYNNHRSKIQTEKYINDMVTLKNKYPKYSD